MLALSAAHYGSHYLDFCSLFIAHYFIDYLVNRLLTDFTSADGTMRDSDSRVKQTKVVVYFCHGSDC